MVLFVRRSWRRAVLGAVGTLLTGTFLVVGGSERASGADAVTLAKDLSAKETKTRSDAVDAIGGLGAEGKPAVIGLVAALNDSSPDVRWRAARALANVGANGDNVVGALAGGLKDDNPTVRAYSAYALGTLGVSTPAVVEGLGVQLTDKESLVRRAALRALQKLKLPRDVSIPLFVKTLSSAQPDAVMAALHTLAEAGETAVPFLQDALANPQAASWACMALAQMGPSAKMAVPGLTKLTASKQPNLRLEASMALGSVGPDAKDALPALAKLAESDPLPGVRYAAAFAIGGIATKDATATSVLEKLGQGDDKFLCTVSNWALARIEPNNDARMNKAVNCLIEGLQSDNAAVRLASVRALQDLKAASEKVGAALVAALKDADPEVAKNAIAALGSMGPQITPQIVETLKNPALRNYALTILEGFGPAAKAAVPDLVKLLDDPKTDTATRREVHFLLGQIGPESAPATATLVKALGSDNERVRNSAIFALGRIGPAAHEAVPALEKLTSNDDMFMHVGGLWALVQIKPADAALAAQAVPELTKGLSSDREMVQVEAARTLGMLGAAAKSALPALKKATEDPSPLVADAAAKAIGAIESVKEAPKAPATSQSAAPAAPSVPALPKAAPKPTSVPR